MKMKIYKGSNYFACHAWNLLIPKKNGGSVRYVCPSWQKAMDMAVALLNARAK